MFKGNQGEVVTTFYEAPQQIDFVSMGQVGVLLITNSCTQALKGPLTYFFFKSSFIFF